MELRAYYSEEFAAATRGSQRAERRTRSYPPMSFFPARLSE